MNTEHSWEVGDKCRYLYKGPHGMSAPEVFPAVVVKLFKQKVRIEAFDGIEKFQATVWPKSLLMPSRSGRTPGRLGNSNNAQYR